MEGIRRALVLCLVLIAGTAIEQAPSVGPHSSLVFPFTEEVQERHSDTEEQEGSRHRRCIG